MGEVWAILEVTKDNKYKYFLKICNMKLSLKSIHYIYGLVEERHNSSALAMELRLSCTNLSIYADS